MHTSKDRRPQYAILKRFSHVVRVFLLDRAASMGACDAPIAIRADPPVSPARTIPGRPLIVSLKCLAYEDPHFSRQLVRPGCKLMPAIPLRRRIGRPFYRRSGDVCAFSPGTTACRISATASWAKSEDVGVSCRRLPDRSAPPLESRCIHLPRGPDP